MGVPADNEDKIVVRGLEGVVAAETRISYVDGANGQLYYQGYSIHDLAEKTSFEEIVFLLWNARLPDRRELAALRSDLVSDMRLPSQVIKMIELTPPNAHPMSVLRTAISMLSMYDPDANLVSEDANSRKARNLVAQVPTIIADLNRIRAGKPVLSPDPELGIAGNFLYMMRGTPPDDQEQLVMDLLFMLHADHGLNASTFTARVIASTLSDMHSALAGAIGSLKGPLHGGANQRVMEMLDDIEHPERVQEYIQGMLENRQRIMGFGHRVYRTEDPRARHLRKYSEQLCNRTDKKHLYDISHRIEKIVTEAKGIYPNVDFYSATVQHALGIPTQFFTAVFAASRAAGWIAHVIEQYSDNRLIRPTSKYVGELGRSFVPLDRR
ncbi:MAG: citrate synthase [Planctomycetes bacterium]|nr:citrate synthase [Planctomycetota bacterium]